MGQSQSTTTTTTHKSHDDNRTTLVCHCTEFAQTQARSDRNAASRLRLPLSNSNSMESVPEETRHTSEGTSEDLSLSGRSSTGSSTSQKNGYRLQMPFLIRANSSQSSQSTAESVQCRDIFRTAPSGENDSLPRLQAPRRIGSSGSSSSNGRPRLDKGNDSLNLDKQSYKNINTRSSHNIYIYSTQDVEEIVDYQEKQKQIQKQQQNQRQSNNVRKEMPIITQSHMPPPSCQCCTMNSSFDTFRTISKFLCSAGSNQCFQSSDQS